MFISWKVEDCVLDFLKAKRQASKQEEANKYSNVRAKRKWKEHTDLYCNCVLEMVVSMAAVCCFPMSQPWKHVKHFQKRSIGHLPLNAFLFVSHSFLTFIWQSTLMAIQSQPNLDQVNLLRSNQRWGQIFFHFSFCVRCKTSHVTMVMWCPFHPLSFSWGTKFARK